MKKLIAAAVVAFLGTTGVASAMTLQEALSNDLRQPVSHERDKYRHPAETLAFFGVKDSMTVIELWPGSGWYAEILAPYLARNGQYVAANFETSPKEDTKGNQYRAKLGKAFEDWLSVNAAKVGKATIVTFDPPAKTKLGETGTADVVLTFRNIHNWAWNNQAEAMFSAAFDVLKPGGVLGVVEHRANPGMDMKLGYMEEGAVIKLAEAAGFKLEKKSEINANPKDTKDYAEGVWTLPPSLRLGDTDKDKYLAIGESDRMTLKFVKPATKQ
ncbi:methyltransferase [Shewanella sp. JM162201]|uniref:Methyltransferase n=1 Tax=Shewanella jiangmenensis TaxID=2837387 RepID=A0ABS5V538_9GAMM|nr:methyltransferase [Shewanella jiangmenensis]MBT1445585.1 methyltransferase [Shewanella jiangmenensis]